MKYYYIPKIIKDAFSSCPYTIVGKKITLKLFGHKTKIPKNNLPNNKELHLQLGIKTGRNIALVGLFCPIFWLSLFLGAAKSILLTNAIHSGIVVCIGLIYASINYFLLRRLQLKHK